MLIPKDDSAETSPVISRRVNMKNSPSFEEISSVTHTESFSVENTAFSPVTSNNGTESFHMARNAPKQMEPVNHLSQPFIKKQFIVKERKIINKLMHILLNQVLLLPIPTCVLIFKKALSVSLSKNKSNIQKHHLDLLQQKNIILQNVHLPHLMCSVCLRDVKDPLQLECCLREGRAEYVS
ncbi:protein C21orf2 [Trichonephila clavipes]|nr:protein C21orf2 [Trichonephila clavipes]